MANAIELEILPGPELPARPDPGHRQDRHDGRPVLHRHLDDQHVHRDLGRRRRGNATNVTSQSGAIGLALFATAGGLMTAIPLVFAHVLFKAWVAKFEVEMKAAAQKLSLLFQTLKPKQRRLEGGAVARRQAEAARATDRRASSRRPSPPARRPARGTDRARAMADQPKRSSTSGSSGEHASSRRCRSTSSPTGSSRAVPLPDDRIRPSGTTDWYPLGDRRRLPAVLPPAGAAPAEDRPRRWRRSRWTSTGRSGPATRTTTWT